MNRRPYIFPKKRSFRFLTRLAACTWTIFVILMSQAGNESRGSELSSILLHDAWEFRQDGSEEWKPITLPSSFESHEGTDFNGVGWYRRRIPLPDGLNDEARVVLRFEGAATEATVWCQGVEVGRHLGGWTPFECDITDAMQQLKQLRDTEADRAQPAVEVLVRLDELVGHNSQGFLPVFAPHFGGLWKDVRLCIRSPISIDIDELFVRGDVDTKTLLIEAPVTVHGPVRQELEEANLSIRIQYRSRVRNQDGSFTLSPWTEYTEFPLNNSLRRSLMNDGRCLFQRNIEVPTPEIWSPDKPVLYDVVLQLVQIEPGPSPRETVRDIAQTTAGFRSIEARGAELRLNGRPIQVRGILNWGYAPPRTAPSLDPEFWAKELDLVQAYGFNLMKFCLWVPPKDYLRMADERGIMVWIEYPTWHSKWTADQLPTLEREFDEFFRYDRPHPCVILRSLTCETGPSADLNVLRSLYDRCHDRIPGSIVEDDSSWIQWNRIHDFYDDHPYGNNHTWGETLGRLKQYIDERESKPLMLGEAIAADTWLSADSLAATVGEDRPFWLPGFFDANRKWEEARRADMGTRAVDRLTEDSLDYALRMRKFQIETYRREVPFGGYVVSVIRDFPLAGMGLLDYQGIPKWPKEAWAWHADRTLILKTQGDRRSFASDEMISGQILLSDFGSTPARQGILRLTLSPTVEGVEAPDARVIVRERRLDCDDRNGLKEFDAFEFSPKELLGTLPKDPIEVTLSAEWIPSEAAAPQQTQTKQAATQNAWQLWLVPRPNKATDVAIGLHGSCSARTRGLVAELGETTDQWQDTNVVVAQAMDIQLLDRIEAGANVLFLPDGEKHSLPLQSHWFLRGGPIVGSGARLNAWHPMIRQLQHFDLASNVVPNLGWLSELTPMIMLWDNHDIRDVRTHGLLFGTRIGRGTLLVNALDVYGAHNAAGKLVAQEYLNALFQPERLADFVPGGGSIQQLSEVQVASLREQLQERSIELTERTWRFRVDPSDEGKPQGWYLPEQPLDQGWEDIHIGKHWDSQGYASLDGWAWYAIDLELPADWDTETSYLWIDGGDDYYEAFVDGRLVGSAGDIESRRTAFEERATFEIPELRSSDTGGSITVRIAIRVFDWQGAGGLFRPIHWKTIPRSNLPRILK